jgi:AcrR family transcriptional regulator
MQAMAASDLTTAGASAQGTAPVSGATNNYGQRIGSKGERTRRLLIETTVGLLESHGLREVAVADVARAAQTSPATFYVYFRGVPEVVLAALETASQTSPELEALIGRDWLAAGADEAAAAFVGAYTELWNRNGTVFRVRNLASEEGDARFYQARMDAARPMIEAIAAGVTRAQAAGRVPAHLTPIACAATMLMMLERLSAVGPLTREGEGLSYATLKAAAAHSLAGMLGARS